MNTDKNELSLDEMEMANGGVKAGEMAAACGIGGIMGGLSAASYGVVLGLAAGPVGWLTLGCAAVGAAAYGTYYALTEK